MCRMKKAAGRWKGTYEFAAELPEVYELAEDAEAGGGSVCEQETRQRCRCMIIIMLC